ncbi:MAG: hypothetical protein JWN18_43 [Parcubacteria group bacterium]|nr:hypothetical protein [Parcubacteria group bacterium]
MEGKPSSENTSTELKVIFDADQAERLVGYENINLVQMRENDKPRLDRAREIYNQVKEEGLVLDGEDLWRLGMLYQHSAEPEDYLTAMEIANMSSAAGSEAGAWLTAAAEDRYLLSVGKDQKWGTQFAKNDEGQWYQQPMSSDEESGITDDMRATKGISPRAVQMEEFLKRDDV